MADHFPRDYYTGDAQMDAGTVAIPGFGLLSNTARFLAGGKVMQKVWRMLAVWGVYKSVSAATDIAKGMDWAADGRVDVEEKVSVITQAVENTNFSPGMSQGDIDLHTVALKQALMTAGVSEAKAERLAAAYSSSLAEGLSSISRKVIAKALGLLRAKLGLNATEAQLLAQAFQTISEASPSDVAEVVAIDRDVDGQ